MVCLIRNELIMNVLVINWEGGDVMPAAILRGKGVVFSYLISVLGLERHICDEVNDGQRARLQLIINVQRDDVPRNSDHIIDLS